MSWWSKHVTNGKVGNVLSAAVGTDIFNGKDGLVYRYANDFKDWYDGTAAQRKANRMNIENWNLQNAYNTPAAQMARYGDAGLNPNLIYSQSNEAGSIASVSPAMSGAEQLSKAAQTIASFYSIAGMIANVKNLQQQNNNLKSQNSLLSAQADFTREQARRYGYETDWLQNNGTSSFDSPTVRSSKSIAREYADGLGSWVGTQAGKAMNAIDAPHYVLRPSDFSSEAEMKAVFKELSRQGAYVEIEWPKSKSKRYEGMRYIRY